jgi:putative heme-binding domain-containing protein
MLLISPAARGQGRSRNAPDANPHTTPDDIARGQHIYNGSCQGCHGPAGDGGRGPRLAVPRLPRARTDAALFRIIRFGLPGTEMPGGWSMTDRETWQVVAFVRTLGRVESEPLPGDAARGEALFWSKGNCGNCHMVAGRGGRLGPELTDIGLRRGANHLKTSLLDPEAHLPEDFLSVRLVTRDGRKITGVRLNESTFTIQVRDMRSDLHSFFKTELAELHYDKGKSPMPSYRALLTPDEIEHAVAYLAGLRGEE